MTEQDIRRIVREELRAIVGQVPDEPRVLLPATPHVEPFDVAAVALATDGLFTVTTRTVAAAMGVSPERLTRAVATRIGTALRRAGWTVQARRGGGARERVYRRT